MHGLGVGLKEKSSSRRKKELKESMGAIVEVWRITEAAGCSERVGLKERWNAWMGREGKVVGSGKGVGSRKGGNPAYCVSLCV